MFIRLDMTEIENSSIRKYMEKSTLGRLVLSGSLDRTRAAPHRCKQMPHSQLDNVKSEEKEDAKRICEDAG